MEKIKIAITGRVASVVALPEVVADNAEYEVDFALDPREGWDVTLPITALFVRRDGSYTPRIMDAGKTSCTMPPQTGTNIVYVGLTQDDMRTTTPATIKVRRSIRTVANDPLPTPTEDVYAQILAAYAGIKTISGKGAPTSATQGKVNQLYRDEDTQRLYICTATDGGYTWAAVSGGSVDVDATLTKAGYAADAKAAGDAIGGKLDKAQGKENAGTVLVVADDGNIYPLEPSYLPGFVSYTREQGLTYDQQVLAKQNIGAGTLRQVYYWNAIGTPENPNSVLTCAVYGDTCICGGLGGLPDGMKAPVLVIYGSDDRGYREATAFDGSNATWTFTVNLRDYSYSTPIKKSGVPAPTTAQVGQIVKVKAVDESGKITETEAVDMPSGEKWELIKTIDIADGAAETTALTIDTDNNGNAFSLKKCRLFARFPAYTGETTIPNFSFTMINKLTVGNHSPLSYTSGFPKLRTDGYTGTVWEVDVSGLMQYEKVMRTVNNTWGSSVYGYINSQTEEYWADKRIQSITSIGGTQMIIFPGCHFELHGVRE